MNFRCSYSETVDIHKIIENPKNNNKHPDKQIDLLAKIIDYQGQRSPIVVSNRSGFIVKGHGRLMAIKKLGWEKAAVDYQDYESEAQEYADLIADNKIAELAEFDEALMIEELKNIDLDDYDLLGIPDFEMPEPEIIPQADAEDIPEHVETRCKPGDLWTLGKHRLLCGDSTMVDHVERLMNGEQADLVFTDPPYNVDYHGSDGQSIQNDNMSKENFYQFCQDFYKSYFLAMREGAGIYVFHSSAEVDAFVGAFREVGFHYSGYLIWNKNALIMGRSDYQWKHEPCIYGWKPGASHNWYSDRSQTTVFDHDKGSGVDNKMHPTSKPISLVEYYVNNSSKKNDLVIDFFGGSGSTMIACEKNNRRCNTLELDPHYCDVILQRWEEYTGKKATLEV